MYTIHLFAGAGGGILADLILGHTPIAACEIEPYPRRVLIQRQLDGILPVFPVWDDVRTLRDDNPKCAEAFSAWRAVRDNLAICGGFPCQDISAAGKGAGITGERSGLWSEFARVIREIRPRFVFVENSPVLTSRGLGVVLGDLAEMGYDARWGVLGACDAGAPHQRDRIWLVADHVANAGRQRGRRLRIKVGGAFGSRQGWSNPTPYGHPWAQGDPADAKGSAKPRLGRVADGVAYRAYRLAAIGNGQVPACAAMAWRILRQ